MSGRYLIRLGVKAAVESEDPHLPLRRTFARGTVCLWSDEDGIDIDSRGYIVGHLFEKGKPGCRVTRLGKQAREDIIQSSGRALLERYWGGYVAILASPPDQEISILRDPSGALPCLTLHSGEQIIVASDIQLAASLSTRPIQIDYLELARFISGTDQLGRRTCLAAVDEILPGEQLHFLEGRVAAKALWSPWSFTDPLGDGPDLLASLQACLMDCTSSWASCFEHIVLGVSGGLDSSIVAVGVSKVCPDLRCFTMIGPDPDGDESAHARVLTDFLGRPLQRVNYDIDCIDIERPVLPHLPWPVGSLFLQGIEQAHQELVERSPVDAYFAGNGGDGVLCNLSSASPLADRFQAEKFSRGFMRTLRDICDLTGADALTVLRLASRRLTRRRDGFVPHRDILGLTPTIVERLGPAVSHHPWLSDVPKRFPGKWAHVAMITRSHRSIEFHPRTEPPQIAPLLSQPIVELCLAIPTWLWVAGGRDRSMARGAMEDILPRALLKRTGKGGPDGFMHLIYRTRRSEIRSFLRDGLLVANGLLDPSFLDQPFDLSANGRGRVRRMLAFVAAESWARAWSR